MVSAIHGGFTFLFFGDDEQDSLTTLLSGPSNFLRGIYRKCAIDFSSVKQPEDLALAFNAHRILIVPSLTSDTFGLVAVEGMACGCLVVGSDLGGLRETIGPCGLTFLAGDVVALTALIERLLEHPQALVPSCAERLSGRL